MNMFEFPKFISRAIFLSENGPGDEVNSVMFSKDRLPAKNCQRTACAHAASNLNIFVARAPNQDEHVETSRIFYTNNEKEGVIFRAKKQRQHRGIF